MQATSSLLGATESATSLAGAQRTPEPSSSDLERGDDRLVRASPATRSPPARPRRNYTAFPGRSKFWCDGRIMQGPDTTMILATVTLILAPSAVFAAVEYVSALALSQIAGGMRASGLPEGGRAAGCGRCRGRGRLRGLTASEGGRVRGVAASEGAGCWVWPLKWTGPAAGPSLFPPGLGPAPGPSSFPPRLSSRLPVLIPTLTSVPL